MLDMSKLNEEQTKPALDTQGAVLVTAGAGSGKTRLLTYRICHIISNLHIDPSRVLAITFTNKATNEMRERITNMLGESVASNIWISTFHAMCVRILRENANYFVGYNRFFTIYDTSDKEKLIKKIIKDNNFDSEIKKDAIWHISNAKNEGLSPDEYRKLNSLSVYIDKICDIYAIYQNELSKSNAFDFDDLLVKTLELFTNYPKVLEHYSDKFMYILVDEFQDTNSVQYKLVRLLAQKHGNIFVVGDEDQCIYGWRGANVNNIASFRQDFDAKCYKLEQNYRSTKTIIDSANKLIKHNSSRIDKTLWTSNEQGDNITLYEAYDEGQEAEYVVQSISRKLESGIKASEIAILTRVSSLTMQFEQKLLNYNIPYVVYGNIKFFERAIVKNLLAYMKVAINPMDTVSMERIINFPKRSIGNASVEKLLEIANNKGISLLEVILRADEFDEISSALKKKLENVGALFADLIERVQTMNTGEFFEHMIKVANIKSEYSSDSDEDNDNLMHIDMLASSIETFEKYNPNSTVFDYITSVTLENSYEEIDNVEQDKVVISTIHAAKGLEFDYVYIVGCEKNIFPVSRAFDDPDDMEEERRLMYVALTRAKKKVFITRAKCRYLYGQKNKTSLSQFVEEMGLVQKPNYESRRSRIDEARPVFSKSFSSLQDFISKAQQKKKETPNLSVGDSVKHPRFGVGKVIKLENFGSDQYALIDFDDVGVKQLAIKFAPLTKI